MIYEVRTYQIQPGSLQEVLSRFGEAYEHRKRHSELAAFWYSEIGPLNQIVHVWPYENAAERDRIAREYGLDVRTLSPGLTMAEQTEKYGVLYLSVEGQQQC
jgi:hypothetical protein